MKYAPIVVEMLANAALFFYGAYLMTVGHPWIGMGLWVVGSTWRTERPREEG